MRRLSVFQQVSLDGYFVDGSGEMDWAKKAPSDAEWNAFVSGNASGGVSGGGALVFGRVTYQMMASFWPTPMAAQMMPEVAKAMNTMPKYVFSRTMKRADWSNTTLVGGDAMAGMGKLKRSAGPDLVVLGSGSLVAALAQARLIDAYQVIVNPLVLGAGRSMFSGVKPNLHLKLTSTRTFGNGNVLLNYEPAA